MSLASLRKAPGMAASMILVPGSADQTVGVTVSLVARRARHRNEVGLFLVDDATGRVGGLSPGDRGYAAAALSRRLVLFHRGQEAGAVAHVDLSGASYFGTYLVTRSTSERFLSINPQNHRTRRPNVYFSTSAANPDHRFPHVRQVGPGLQAIEDLGGGGDRDFNDAVLRFDFAVPPPGTPSSGGETGDVLTLDFGLAPSSDTPPVGDAHTLSPLVTLIGTTAPGATVVLAGSTVIAGTDGHFAIPNVPLALGVNRFVGTSTLAGKTATASREFTRDLTVSFGLDPAADSLPLGDDHTLFRTVTLVGVTEPGAVVGLAGSTVTAGPDGHFSVPGVPLVMGGNPFTATATAAGQTATAARTVVLDCGFLPDLAGWTVGEQGGTTPGRGSVTVAGTDAVLREGNSFDVTFQTDFVIPSGATSLDFDYANLAFDATAVDRTKDAFEVALVDAAGNPLVHAISGQRDAFFNVTEGLPPALGSEASISGQTVTLGLAGVHAGTPARLVFRLVNNDSDTGTSVHITCVDLPAGSTHTSFSSADVAAAQALVTNARAAGSASGTSAPLLAVSPSPAQTKPGPAIAATAVGQSQPGAPASAPALTVEPISTDNSVPAGTTVLVSGVALASTTAAQGTDRVPNAIASVTINGQPAEAIDAAGRFFSRVVVAPGKTSLSVVAIDSYGQEVAASMVVTGDQRTGAQVDFDSASDVSGSFKPLYARTSFNDRSSILYSDVAIANVGDYPVDAPLYVGVKAISDPGVRVLQAAGVTPAGIPYYDFTGLVTGGRLTPSSQTGTLSLTFSDPGRTPFTYQLVFFGLLNRPPAISSVPVVEANPGRPYTYQVRATDPDSDPLTYKLLSGPLGMTINPQTGAVAWSPGTADLGTHDVSIQVSDGRGGLASQRYAITAKAPGPNRPPVFTSTPVVDAQVGVSYNYPATASDADGDPLTFSVVAGPTGLSIDALTGAVSWSPTGAQFGPNAVTLKVDDGRGGSALQSFTVQVGQAPGNHPPVIISQPVTSFALPTPAQAAGGSIFLTGHDPDFHAQLGGNSAGARDINRTAIHFVTDPAFNTFAAKGITKFLFVESRISPPGGHVDGLGGLTSSGYTPGTDFDLADASALNAALDKLGTTYDAIVVGSDFGGILTQAELDILVARSADIIKFLNAGGGLYAMAESDNGAHLTPNGHQFAYLPFIVTSTPADQSEVGIALSAFGAGLGLTTSDVNGNASHNVFEGDFGLNVVDRDSQNRILTLAGRGQVTQGGVGAAYTYDVSAIDPDRDVVTYSLVRGPSGMTIDPSSGVVTWAVQPSDVGPHNIAVRADDGRGGSDVQPYVLVVGTQSGGIAGTKFNDVNHDGVRSPVDASGGPGGTTPGPITLTQISTTFNSPIDPAYYEPNNSIIASVNYSGGQPRNFEEILPDGTHRPFSAVSGLTDEVYIATARSGNLGGFVPGDLFVGSGRTGEVVRITDGGATVQNPWVTLPGARGLLRGGLTFDKTGLYNGDLIITTDSGQVWRVGTDRTPRMVADVHDFLEGVEVVPDDPARYGPLAGKILAPDEQKTGFYVISPDGTTRFQNVGIASIEEIHVIPANENFFGVDYGSGRVVGAPASGFQGREGDLLIVTEGGSPGLYTLSWDGSNLVTTPIAVTPGSVPVSSWEGTTFAPAGISEVPPLPLEPGLPAWTIYLDQNRNGRLDPGERSTVTDARGLYSFDGLAPGDYVVAEEPQAGWSQTAPASQTHLVTVEGGRTISGIDFGNTSSPDVVNHSPKITSTALVVATANVTYRYYATASDRDLDPLTFDLVVAPSGMTIDPTTGVIAWTPTSAQTGVSDVILRVQDPQGAVNLQSYRVTVGQGNTPPAITDLPTAPASVGNKYRFRVRAQDAEGDPITFRLDMAPPGMAIDAMSGVLTWTPSADQVGSQTARVTASDGRGETSADFTIPVFAAAPNDDPTITSTPRTAIRLGNSYTYPVMAADPNGDPLIYTLETAPVGMTIDASGMLTWTPSPSQFGDNPVSILVEDGRGGSAAQTFLVSVASAAAETAPTIVSTPYQGAVVGKTYAYEARATDADGDPIVWALDSGPAGMSIDAETGSVRWTPMADQIGLQKVEIRALDGRGGYATQTYNVAVRGVNTPPSIRSTPTTAAAVGAAFIYAVGATDPDNDPLAFSLTKAPAGMTIDPASGLLLWTPSDGQVGPQDVTVRVADDQGGAAEQSFRIVVSGSAENRPPSIRSTPAFVATEGVAYGYQVVATDPESDPLAYSLLTSPPGMTIDATSGLLTWTPAVGRLGPVTVTVAAVDPSGNGATQTYTLNVLGPDRPPVIVSTPPPAAIAGAPFRYDLRASDPDGEPLTFALSSAPAGMAIDPKLGRITWTPGAGDAGTSHVVATVSDGRGGTATQTFDVAVGADTEAPSVAVTASPEPGKLGAAVSLLVAATDNVSVATVKLTVDGTPLAVDALGRATFTPDHAGLYAIVAVATDPAGNVGKASKSLAVFDPSATGAPTVSLPTLPGDGVITGPTDIVGTVGDPNLLYYTVSLVPSSGGAPIEIARGTSAVENGVLAHLDPSSLANDTYSLQVTAVDVGGGQTTSSIPVNIAGSLKLGQFQITFNDLSVPVAGVPMVVTRSYDTHNAGTNGDFGFGWRLEYRSVDVRTSIPPSGSEDEGFYNAIHEGDRVYITLPGGKREGFTFHARPTGFLFLTFWHPRFIADPGVTDTLSVPDETLFRLDDGSYTPFLSGFTYNPFDPNFNDTLTLTQKDGTTYQIDAQSKELRSVSDAHGNTLSFSDAGIVSSAGPAISFTRDPRGRITSITDPSGRTIRYEYDARGDLVATTDRVGNRTSYTYLTAPSHYLNSVVDPLGHTGAKTLYDDQGRLSQIVGPSGATTTLTYDPSHSIETTVNALGNATTYVYDDRGNIVTEIDALGGTLTRTHDANNRKLSETDANGNTTRYTYDDAGNQTSQTDPLGNVTRYTYDAHGLIQAEVDPLGNTQTYRYDDRGNLVASTDALGNTTSYTTDRNGNPTSFTDPLGAVTHLVFDANGNETSEVDPLGHETGSTFDGNGNLLSETSTLTTPSGRQAQTTLYSYDAEGDILSTTDALGNVTTYTYDALGHRSRMVDALGRTTSYAYDDFGDVLAVRYPDGTSETSTYDAGRRKTSSTDRSGRTTLYHYDVLDRLIETIYPDDTPSDLSDNPRTEIAYDKVGHVVAKTDELGRTTRLVYDADGRLVALVEPDATPADDSDNPRQTFEYDAAGRLVAKTDELGHRTAYDHDAEGRVTRITYADGSALLTRYDALGRIVAITDESGSTTLREYDAAGRLTAVVDPLGGRTALSYDEAGNRTGVTDASGHTTATEYNLDNQPVAVILPLGERSTTQYDKLGRPSVVTDADGRSITYEYNASGRVSARHEPGGLTTSFTYTPTGLVFTATDARGVTRYTYDARDRLIRRVDPDGTTLSYTYDAAGETTSVSSPAGTTRYAFDARGRVAGVTGPDGLVTTYSYDASGNLTRVALPDGSIERRLYDLRDRLVSVQDTLGSTVISGFTYTLDASGARSSLSDSTGRRVVYTYDKLHRLTGEAITDPVSGNRTITYTYDAAGNRLTRNDSVAGLTADAYDSDNRLVTETTGGVVTTYTYDRSGHTLTRDAGPTDRTAYGWNALGELVHSEATTVAGTTATDLTYDAAGRLVAETVGGVTTTRVVDDSPLYRVLGEFRGGVAVVTYVQGIGTISQNRGGVVSYYHADGQGSTAALTDASGAVTDRYTYDAFGRLLGSSGATPNSVLFSGASYDSALGLYNLRARFLSTALGRFLSQDPHPASPETPSSLHRYTYTHNDPVNFVDPSGLQELIEELAVIETIDALAVAEEGYLAGVGEAVADSFVKGTIGAFWRTLGADAEAFAARAVLIGEEAEIAGSQVPVGTRVIDFLLRGSNVAKEALLEVKYSISTNPQALARLAGQMTAMVEEGEGAQAVVFTLRQPTAAALARLAAQVSPEVFGQVRFVSGVEELFQFVAEFFI